LTDAVVEFKPKNDTAGASAGPVGGSAIGVAGGLITLVAMVKVTVRVMKRKEGRLRIED
jgi:hypothetical protein